MVTTIHQAKTNLSRLIERAERGEEIVIARGKRPVVRLVAVGKPARKRFRGLFRGEFELGPAFFEPCPRKNSLSGNSADAVFSSTRTR